MTKHCRVCARKDSTLYKVKNTNEWECEKHAQYLK